MKDGNWISLDKNLAKHFPDRKYSEIEAAFSLTLDYDNNRKVTISGYSKLWGWSRSKVRSFLESMGVDILYPEDTTKKQKQKGQIKKQIKDRTETEKGQIRMVDTKVFDGDKDSKKTETEQKKNRRKDTTSKPSNNPKPNPLTDKQKFIDELPESVFKKGHSRNQVLNTIDDLIDYSKSKKGRKYDDYYAALRNFLKKVTPDKKAANGEKITLEKYKEAFQYKINNPEYIFKDQSINDILKEYPLILEYDMGSKKFELTYKEYLKL